jgi:prepilin-type N-terminal cleavage/methylation domain-containing protein
MKQLISMKQVRSIRTGFTLVELIIVIAIIAILAAAIFVAIDPARRLHEARNARRQSDVNTLVDAIKQYQVDHGGDHYTIIQNAQENVYHIIGQAALVCEPTCTAIGDTAVSCLDLRDMGTNYLSQVPMDPKIGTPERTWYYLMKDSNGSITVGACEPEGEGPGGTGVPPKIEATR